MEARARLNATQLDVLRWIAAGCPDGVMQGFTYKTTALALQGRRLVTVNKKGGVWRATMTEAGTFYLDHGDYLANTDEQGRGARRQAPSLKLDPRAAGTPTAPVRPSRPEPAPTPDGASPPTQKATATPKPIPRPTPKPLPPTEQLVADVVAAGGELEINRVQRSNIETLIRAVNRYGKGPGGRQLVIEHRPYPASIVRLVDPPAWFHAVLEPVVVPEALRRPHPVVTALRQQKSFRVTGAAQHRALLLVQALVAEAERRGHRVGNWRGSSEGRGYVSRESTSDVVVTIQGHEVGLQVTQQMDRVPHEPTAAELRRAERDSWYRVPTQDAVPSSRLTITVSGQHEHRQSTWNDTQRVSLETRLAQVLQEVELRAAAMERDRVAREQAALDKRRRWEAAMEVAKVELVEHHRAEKLQHQVDRWQRAAAVRDYCDVLERQTSASVGGPNREVAAWVEWARQYADRIDPLRNPVGMPADPTATPEALKPFLHGWSPYGPGGW